MNALFDQPMTFAAIAVFPVLAAFAWIAGRRRRQALQTMGNPKANGQRSAGLFAGWGLVIALLIVAAAGPRWGSGPPSPTKPGCDVLLAVDLSRSMLTQDALPNRLERGKDAINDLIDAVQARGGSRLGVVAFAGQSRIVCPLTHDYDHVRSKIASLSADPLPASLAASAISGTRIGAGLRAAVDAHDPQHRGAQLILLVSDGDDPANDDEWREGIAAARSAGIPVFSVGVGDPANESEIPIANTPLTFRGQPAKSRLHEPPLREIAARTSGEFVSSGTAKPDLNPFVRETMNRHATREAVGETLPQAAPRYMWFLVPSLLLSLILMLPCLVWRPRLATAGAAVLLVAAVSASDRELRRGVAALDAGWHERALAHFAAAGERTTDPGLVAFNEGIALYHLGRFREAEQRFRWSLSDAEGVRRANALYNLGCALLQASQGRIAEPLRNAVAALERSLAGDDLPAELRDPARENLELAKRLLAQLPPESPTSGDSSNDQPSMKPPNDSAREAMNPGNDRSASSVASGAQDAKSGQGKPQLTDRPPPPGKGSLPPLPDDDVLTSMTPADAKAHLELAAARIEAARKAQLQSRGTAPAAQFPDW